MNLKVTYLNQYFRSNLKMVNSMRLNKKWPVQKERTIYHSLTIGLKETILRKNKIS